MALISLGGRRVIKQQAVAAIDLIIAGGGREFGLGQGEAALVEILASPAGQRFLGVHRYGDALWFNREAFMELVRWMMVTAAVAAIADGKDEVRLRIDEIQQAVDWVVFAGEDSSYQMDEFLDSLGSAAGSRSIED